MQSAGLRAIHLRLQTTLILRPRRWGKTTMMSMVKYFLDVSQQQLARQLFANSLLAKRDPRFYEETCGQYPVIFLSFGACTGITWPEMKNDLTCRIGGAFRDWRQLMDSQEIFEDERKMFRDILWRDEKASYQVALTKLTHFLHRIYKKRVIVLIDEYEKPLIVAFLNGFLNDAVAFLSSALTGCLKDNPYGVVPFAIPHMLKPSSY